MTSPQKKLAKSLEVLRSQQDRGAVAIRSSDLTRTHRERLLKNGFIDKVMKGWYIPASPQESSGESTSWYASFWTFCAAYLQKRFGTSWSLSPEQSLLLHVGNMTVPLQLHVRSPKSRNKITSLPHNTSLFEMRAIDVIQVDMTQCGGILETKKICSTAETYSLMVAPHNVGGIISDFRFNIA